MTQALLGAAIGLPLLMAFACLAKDLRDRMPALLPFAPLPGLAAAVLVPDGTTLVLPQALLGLTFTLDVPGALLLGAASLLWIAAGVFAGPSLEGRPDAGRFAAWWLATLAGSAGVFIAADLVGFYLFFTIVSLAAYGLIVDTGTPKARRAGAINVSFALLAEAFLLMGFVILAAGVGGGNALIRDAVGALADAPWREAALALVILGFGVKIALVPFHVWMPLTYAAAPIPAAAVLSGAAVKAGVIGLIRFLPFESALADWGTVLVAAGFLSAFYGVAIGMTQSNPRTVLAYSSVSQMGLIAAVLGMGLAAGNQGVTAAAAFYAVHHVLAKGGLFLAIGVLERTGPQRPWPVMLPAAVLALALGGLPFTGGAMVKLAVKSPLGDGMAGWLAMLAAMGSTLLMMHFLRTLAQSAPAVPQREADPPAALLYPWLAIACAAIVLPWILFADIVGTGPVATAFDPRELWSVLWPVLGGVLLSLALRPLEHRLPRIPEGDILALEPRIAHAATAAADAMERLDTRLRQWLVTGVMFLVITTLLAALMIA